MISKSPDRRNRQRQNYIDRCLRDGKDPTSHIEFLESVQTFSMMVLKYQQMKLTGQEACMQKTFI